MTIYKPIDLDYYLSIFPNCGLVDSTGSFVGLLSILSTNAGKKMSCVIPKIEVSGFCYEKVFL